MERNEWIEMNAKLSGKVSVWYTSAFPTDECGNDIDKNATFRGIIETLVGKRDFYDYIGVGDSIIRERCFSKLADITGLDYDYFYYAWLGADS